MTLALTLQTVATPIGDMVLAGDGEGFLHAADFLDHEDRLHRLLARRIGTGSYGVQTGKLHGSASTALTAYFEGELSAINAVPVRMHGTPFQQQVWQGLRAIPAGETRSYGGFAASLGRPEAARAVGHANGANPFNIIIPCHRLIAGSGALTGYAGGIARKHWLLNHETRYSANA